MQKYINLPVYVDNDANCAAWQKVQQEQQREQAHL